MYSAYRTVKAIPLPTLNSSRLQLLAARWGCGLLGCACFLKPLLTYRNGLASNAGVWHAAMRVATGPFTPVVAPLLVLLWCVMMWKAMPGCAAIILRRYLKCVRTTATDGFPGVLSYERQHGFMSYQQEYEVGWDG
jgi:hypothetical protein